MRCVQCGAELPAGSRFCSRCGSKQPEIEAAPAVTHRPEARSMPETASADEVSGMTGSRERDFAAGRTVRSEQAIPPEPGEPLAVRLTKPNGSASSAEARESSEPFRDPEEEAPPQMRPDHSSAVSRFAPAASPSGTSSSARAERGRVSREKADGSPVRVWIAPPLLAICAAAALIWQVNYERGISAEAAEIHRSAADAALGGNYEIAESKLAQALDKRPQDQAIRSDLQTVQTIQRLEAQLTEAQRLLSRSDAAGAAGVLEQVERDLSGLNGTAYDRLRDRLNKLRAKLELADIRSDAEKAGTLAELTGLLKTASTYPTSEQRPVVAAITDRIVEVSGNEADRAIADGSYYEAAAVVDEARGYAPEAKRLIDLEKQIASLTTESDYAAPELFYASGRELASGTGELRMAGFKQEAKDGTLTFSGTLTNASALDMYDLLIEYRSYDADGRFLGEGWTEVSPGNLVSGGTASFSDRLDAGAGAVVVLDSVSWYRE